MTIIDTSVIVAAVERRSGAARQRLSELNERSRRSFVVIGELEFGVCAATTTEFQRVRERSLRYYQLISQPPMAVDLDELSRWFGTVSAIAVAAGIRIGQNDRWIVAEAALADHAVWTADEPMHRLCAAVAEHPDGRPIEVVLLPSA